MSERVVNVLVFMGESYVHVSRQRKTSWFGDDERRSSTSSQGQCVTFVHVITKEDPLVLTPFATTKASPSERGGSSNRTGGKEIAPAAATQQLLQALGKAVTQPVAPHQPVRKDADAL